MRVSDAGGAVAVFVARSGKRFSSQLRIAPRIQYPICVKPPGMYSRMISRPMLDVNSGTVSLFGQNAGSPTTHSAPVTAPARLPRPPITAIDTRVSESSTRKNRSRVPDRDDEAAEQRAAEPGDEARRARTR